MELDFHATQKKFFNEYKEINIVDGKISETSRKGIPKTTEREYGQR